MSEVVFTQELLTKMRERRAGGEKVSALAGEIGVQWQKLDKAMRKGSSTTTTAIATATASVIAPVVETPSEPSLTPVLDPLDVMETSTAPGGGWDPGHPCYYKHGGPIMPADQIWGYRLELPHKLAKIRIGDKRKAMATDLLAKARESLKQTILRYEDVVNRGAEALSHYDRTIAFQNDDDALQGSLALIFNHICYDKGTIAVLCKELGEPATVEPSPATTDPAIVEPPTTIAADPPRQDPPPTSRASLVDKYRPTSLANLKGQPKASEYLTRYASGPYSVAMLFAGETGTGKTSAAGCLAAELGCDVKLAELGGVWSIASGEQTADSVRAVWSNLSQIPMFGSGWKILVCNEADRMSAVAETIWLDRLENLPARCTVIFTTNYPDRLSQRLRDRCLRVDFEGTAKKLLKVAAEALCEIWNHERPNTPRLPESFLELAKSAVDGAGMLSFRRAVQLLQMDIS